MNWIKGGILSAKSEPDWFFDLRVTPLEGAVRALRTSGCVVCLVDDGATPTDLPPAAGEEVDQSRSRSDPAIFLRRRMVARRLAASYLDIPPEELRIGSNAYGAPEFSTETGLFVSFSGRSNLGLVGLAVRPVGVDIEAPVMPDAIPRNILRAAEREYLASLPEGEQGEAFQILWAAKESFAKATGRASEISPEDVAVLPYPPDKPRCNHYRIEFLSDNITIFYRNYWIIQPKGFLISMALLSDWPQ